LTLAAYAAFAALPFLLSQYLQQSAGLPVGVVGLLLAIDGLLVVLLTPALGVAGLPSTSALRRVAGGAATCALGAAALLPLPLTVSAPRPLFLGLVAVGLVVFGIGAALFITPLTDVALRVADRSAAGLAAGTNLAVARTAAAMGVAGVSAVAVAIASWTAPAGADAAGRNPFGSGTDGLGAGAAVGLRDASSAAYHGALALVVCLFLAAAGIAALTARRARVSAPGDSLPARTPVPPRRRREH
jgi:hypothetical protein